MVSDSSFQEIKIRELDVDMIAPNENTMNEATQGGSKTVIIGKPGCFEKNTKIMMFNGITKYVQNVRIGDIIMGWNGKPRTVIELCQGWDIMYRIRIGKFLCNDEKDMILKKMKNPKGKKNRKKNHRQVIVNRDHILTLFYAPLSCMVDIPLMEYLQMKKQKKHKDFFWITYCLEKNEYYLSFFDISQKKKCKISCQDNHDEIYQDNHDEIYQDNHDEIYEKNERDEKYEKYDQYYGFEIEGDDHRFLLGDGSVVHNTGKCLGIDTPIMMHDKKIKKVQDVNVNDRLMGDDGTERRVLSVCQGNDHLYKVIQNTESYIVNSCHIICLRSFVDHSLLELEAEYIFYHPDILVSYGGWSIFFPEPQLLKIIAHKEDTRYYGFEITGNGRFCLGNGIITHNTTLITSLLYEKRRIFPIAFIMSGTEDSNGHYKKIVPSTFVYNKLKEDKINDFITRQKIAKRHLPNPWAILLLDDCTDDPKLFNKPLFQGLYKNGRHWKMWFILSLQYCMDIKPVIRTNIDGVFILRETNLRNRRSLWENYAGIIPEFSLFCTIMDQITNDYTALYIHNATTSNSLEDCLFWYKAKPVPPNFRFGCPDLWKYHFHRYNDDYTEPFIV